MAYEMKPNTGSLFKNDKRTEETHANARGSALIDGVEYWIDAWTNDGNKGKYQSLKFKRKDAAPQKARPEPSPISGDGDDIPF
jgi:hypothetical protein